MGGAAVRSPFVEKEGADVAVRSGLTRLKDLSGSGDNVLVKARFTYEQDLYAHKPYQKGLLWDPSLNTSDTRWVVVYDPDLRLEPGKVYLFNGKDHYFDKRDEVQLLLKEGGYVNELYDTNDS